MKRFLSVSSLYLLFLSKINSFIIELLVLAFPVVSVILFKIESAFLLIPSILHPHKGLFEAKISQEFQLESLFARM